MRGYPFRDQQIPLKEAQLSGGTHVPVTTALDGDGNPTVLVQATSLSRHHVSVPRTLIFDGQPYTYSREDRGTHHYSLALPVPFKTRVDPYANDGEDWPDGGDHPDVLDRKALN